MRKNGFTLIELLAVIVILAIIALIATPIILGIIKDAKEQANQRSVDNYAKAVQNALTRYQLTGKKLEINKLETINGREFNNTDFKVEYEGNVVCHTIEIYEDGNIYLGNCVVNGDNVDYTYGIKRYSNGEIVYFDVKEGEGCTKDDYEKSLDETKKDYLNSSTGYNGYTNKDENNVDIEKLDNQNSCLKFYAFNDDYTDKINLILDHNTTATITWNNKVGTISGPKEVLDKLYDDTKDWNGVSEVKNSFPKQSVVEYIINYEEQKYKARLIEADEIAKITGKYDWKESYYFFHDLSQNSDTGSGDVCKETGCEFKWLYDRTNTNCKDSGCENNSDVNLTGYWTATIASGNSLFMVWDVRFDGSLKTSYVVDGTSTGVRPVIEVSKSKLLK